jgi:hypothetical protein
MRRAEVIVAAAAAATITMAAGACGSSGNNGAFSVQIDALRPALTRSVDSFLEFSLLLAMGRSPTRSPPLRRASLGSHTNSFVNTFSLRTATWLGATLIAAGLLGTAGCSSSSSSSASASAPSKTLTVKQIDFGTTLKHSFQPNGKGSARTEHLIQPDDIVTLGGNLYVGFQNGVGSLGEIRETVALPEPESPHKDPQGEAGFPLARSAPLGPVPLYSSVPASLRVG